MEEVIIFLWSDLIFWGLTATFFLFFLLPKQRHIVEAWHFVGTSKMAVCSGVILAFFMMITALDSIHFQNAHMEDKIQSLLDVILSPLDHKTETSYSEPFATHAYMTSPTDLGGGRIINIKAPLNYIDPNIINGNIPMLQDIIMHVIAGMMRGAFILFFMVVIITRFVPWKKCFKTSSQYFQWKTMIVTLGIICLIVGALLSLSKGYHILGTDKVGEDVFYQSIKSIRTGVLIGTFTTLLLLPLALLLGMLAGFFRGWVDDVIQYIYTVLNAIPNVLLIAASVLVLDIVIEKYSGHFMSAEVHADFRLLALCTILGVTSWTSLCRLVRGETLKLREQDYVKAAIALGTKPLNILKRHILPNLMHIVFITITLDFSGLVLAEAVLSYVGVGVDPAMYSWGNMINAARLELAREPMVWWSLTGAFIFMLSLVLPANLFADVVQKAFDPRDRQVTHE